MKLHVKWVRVKVTLLRAANAALGLFGRQVLLSKQVEFVDGGMHEVPNSRRLIVSVKAIEA